MTIVRIVKRGKKNTRVEMANGSEVLMPTEELINLMGKRLDEQGRDDDPVLKKLTADFPKDLERAKNLVAECLTHVNNRVMVSKVLEETCWERRQLVWQLISKLAEYSLWSDFDSGRYCYRSDKPVVSTAVFNALTAELRVGRMVCKTRNWDTRTYNWMSRKAMGEFIHEYRVTNSGFRYGVNEDRAIFEAVIAQWDKASSDAPSYKDLLKCNSMGEVGELSEIRNWDFDVAFDKYQKLEELIKGTRVKVGWNA